MTLKNDAKFDEELTCALKNDVEGFGELWRNTQNLPSNGLLLTKTYMFELKKCYASIYWRSIQTLKEKWLLVS